jgi:hypothetical protein
MFLALAVGLFTGWHLGLRAGVVAGLVSLAALVLSTFVPGLPLVVYGAIVLWTLGLWVVKEGLPGLARDKDKDGGGWQGTLGTWRRRAGWLWKRRR